METARHPSPANRGNSKKSSRHIEIAVVCALASGLAACGGAPEALDAPLRAKADGTSVLPTQAELCENYPQGSIDQVKSLIGGQAVAAGVTEYITNTCTLRLSRAFNYAGAPIPKALGLRTSEEGLHTLEGDDGKHYAFRVSEFYSYLWSKYGKPDLDVYAASDRGVNDYAFRGDNKKGVIAFIFRPGAHAGVFGHMDVWDGQEACGHAQFATSRRVMLWKTPDAAPDPDDPCDLAQHGDGYYCERGLSGQRSNRLLYCVGGATQSDRTCGRYCSVAAPGYADTCVD